MASVRQTSQTGRPRDPRMNQRVLATALSAYVDLGWSGFSLEGVARRAGVGKAALYLRWSSKEALLHDALQATALKLPEDLDTGSLRGDLLRLASLWLEGFQTPAGLVFLRVYSETAAHPEVLSRFQDELFSERIKVGRSIARRARERQEIPPDASTTLILDIIVGAVMNHVMSTPASLHERMVEQSESYLEQLVDFVMRGIHAAPRTESPPIKRPGKSPASAPTRPSRAPERARPESPSTPRREDAAKVRGTRRRQA